MSSRIASTATGSPAGQSPNVAFVFAAVTASRSEHLPSAPTRSECVVTAISAALAGAARASGVSRATRSP